MRFAYEKIITMRSMEAIQRASNDLAMPENFNQKAFNTLYEGSVEIINKIFYHQLFNRKTGLLNTNLPDADRKTIEHVFSYFILKQKNDFTIYDFFDYDFQDDVGGASVKVEKYSPEGLFEMLGITLRTLIESMDFYQYVIHNEPRFLLESDPDYFVTKDEFKKWEREQTNDSRINRNVSEVKGLTTMNALNNLNKRISILKDIKVDEKTIIYTSKKEGHKLQAIDFKSAKLVNKKYNPDGIATIEMKYIEKNVKELTKALKEIEDSQNFYSDTYGKYAVQVENPISGVVIPPTDTPKTWWLKEVTKANENILEFNDNDQEWTIKARSKTILSSFGNVSNSKSPKILTFYLYWERDSVTLEVDKQAIVLPTDKSIPIISMLRFDKIHENDKLTLKYTLPNDNGEVRIYSSHVSLSVNSNYSANNGDPAIQQNSEDIELLQEQIMDLRKNLASTEDGIWLSIDGDLFTDGTEERALSYNIEKITNDKSLEAVQDLTTSAEVYTRITIKRNGLLSFHDKHEINFNYQPQVNKEFKNIFQLRERVYPSVVYEPIPDQEGSKTYVEVIIKPKDYKREFAIEFWLWYEITGLDTENNEQRDFQIYNWQEDVDSRGYYTGFNGYAIATLKGTQAIGVTGVDKDYVDNQDKLKISITPKDKEIVYLQNNTIKTFEVLKESNEDYFFSMLAERPIGLDYIVHYITHMRSVLINDYKRHEVWTGNLEKPNGKFSIFIGKDQGLGISVRYSGAFSGLEHIANKGNLDIQNFLLEASKPENKGLSKRKIIKKIVINRFDIKEEEKHIGRLFAEIEEEVENERNK